MIIKFKIFEGLDDEKKFWLLNIKDELYTLASLKTIGATDDEIQWFSELSLELNFRHPHVDDNDKKIYINLRNRVHVKKVYNDEYGYNHYNDSGYRWYINNGFKYMGEIIPTPESIEKVEIELNAKKYNL
jgi:hypothetical protein